MKWLWIVLGALVGACSASHGTDSVVDASVLPPIDASTGPGHDAGSQHDAASAGDAGTTREDAASDCTEAPPPFLRLSCPLAAVFVGDTVEVGVHASSGRCCTEGLLRSTPRTVDAHHVAIDSSYRLCGCEPFLPCSTDRETNVTVPTTTPGTLYVTASAETCSITVLATPEPPTSTCAPVVAPELRAPSVIFPGETAAISLRGTGECACDPRMTVDPASARLTLCDCCLACDCAGPPTYVGNQTIDAPAVGEHTKSTSAGDWHYLVADRADCSPLEHVDSVEVFPPTAYEHIVGPRLTWMNVHYTATYCCQPPRVGILDRTLRDGSRSLSPLACGPAFDCDCVGSPHPQSVWHPLGELVPGSYTVRVADRDVSFEVEGGARRGG